ncbi:hypothetical protein J4E91_001945 [Alternaria rosae]|nr:hypothetical protein J4E91_001945 [Alternaria rosae]
MNEVDRQFTTDFNAAVELREKHQFNKYIEALRKMLAHYAIPRYHRIRCLTMLACLIKDGILSEDMPAPDVEADVLRAIAEHTGEVDIDRETPEAEGETDDKDETSGEDMSDEEMSKEEDEDEESKLEVETKVEDNKEGKVPKVDWA